jgi:hypothetical protein
MIKFLKANIVEIGFGTLLVSAIAGLVVACVEPRTGLLVAFCGGMAGMSVVFTSSGE